MEIPNLTTSNQVKSLTRPSLPAPSTEQPPSPLESNQEIKQQALEKSKHSTDLSTTYHADQKIIQSILKDELSDEVIRKLPSDEYIDMLRLVDEYLQTHVNNKA